MPCLPHFLTESTQMVYFPGRRSLLDNPEAPALACFQENASTSAWSAPLAPARCISGIRVPTHTIGFMDQVVPISA
jgi:hypothetical protein